METSPVRAYNHLKSVTRRHVSGWFHLLASEIGLLLLAALSEEQSSDYQLLFFFVLVQ